MRSEGAKYILSVNKCEYSHVLFQISSFIVDVHVDDEVVVFHHVCKGRNVFEDNVVESLSFL
jgi:hypothetical protein